jgi:hypothetical protein
MSESSPNSRFYLNVEQADLHIEGLKAVIAQYAASKGIEISVGYASPISRATQQLDYLYNPEYIGMREDVERDTMVAVTTKEHLIMAAIDSSIDPKVADRLASGLIEGLYDQDFISYLILDPTGNTIGLNTATIPDLMNALINRKFLPESIRFDSISFLKAYWQKTVKPAEQE